MTDPKRARRNSTLECVASGEFGDVWLCGDALEEYRELERRAECLDDETSVREERTLARYFKWYADGGPSQLGHKMYKPQSRMKVGANKVFIHEFKAYQFRIYGAECTYRGRRSFIGTACDPSKKKDKADPAVLQKAAKIFFEVDVK